MKFKINLLNSILFLIFLMYSHLSFCQDKENFKKDGNKFLRNKEFDKAIGLYKQAIALDPNYADALFNMGVAYAKKESWNESIECFSKCIKIKNNDKEAWYNRGFAYLNLGKIEEASANFKQALVIDPYFLRAKKSYEAIQK
jgi:tetratricopeptide (TPR) repeat protein